MKNNLEKKIEEFFLKVDPLAEVDMEWNEEDNLSVNLKVEDPKLFIGEGGQTLYSIEKLLRLFARKVTGESVFLNLDINDYRRRKREQIEEKAREVADEVSITGVEKALPPMNAFQRRIIHSELSPRKDVETESEGEGSERHIVIKPS